VRSSSPVEDTSTSSMAGRFHTSLDVLGWPAFQAAVRRVADSAGGHPMGVLVQPMLAPELGGILFGVDPVTGEDRLVVVSTAGTPEPLVSGRVAGDRTVLGRHGRLLDGTPLSAAVRRRLARLATATRRLFGGPADIEWAATGSQVWLLQARPVTTGPPPVGRGPRMGPGPVAETFPVPLAPLEQGLWLPPLREGIAEALRLTGAASARTIRSSPVVGAIDGWAVADLDLIQGPGRSLWRILDPRGPARRLGASWTVGRLRRALPAVAARMVAETDAHLAAVPAPAGLDDELLLGLLDRAGSALRAVHAHEVLVGALLPAGDDASLAGAALRALAEERGPDRLARRPELLALVPPRIPPLDTLPPPPGAAAPAAPRSQHQPGPDDRPVGLREALRLRTRWLQELQARGATELAGRLVDRGVLADAAQVRLLTPEELTVAVRAGTVPDGFRERAAPTGPPPPAVFRLSAEGIPVPVAAHAVTGPAGTPAGGGRVVGTVGEGPGRVLVVRTLDPALATDLPDLVALVAETGSPLAHLAILAREVGLPTVVGVPDATTRFPAGTTVVVDGRTGEVEQVAGADDARDVR
jgi:pyruvate,water dikinase